MGENEITQATMIPLKGKISTAEAFVPKDYACRSDHLFDIYIYIYVQRAGMFL
jgi:hypothetical protein